MDQVNIQVNSDQDKPEIDFTQFNRVIFELQEKRREIVTLNSQLNETLGQNAIYKSETQKLKEEVEELQKQIKASLSTINLQKETKAAIAAAPNKVHFNILEKQVERLTATCDEQKIALTNMNNEQNALKVDNDKLKTENQRLQADSEEVNELIERLKSEFQKLETEQKFVKNMIQNSEVEYLKENERMRHKIETLEREKERLLEEKFKYLVECHSDSKGKDLTEKDHEGTQKLLEMVDKLKADLQVERNEKAEAQDALKRSLEFQEKIMKQFDSELSEF